MSRLCIYIFFAVIVVSCEFSSKEDLLIEAIKSNSSSVVGITGSDYGSGVIIDKAGYIVTNEHVVRFSDTVNVYIEGGKRYEAKIIGTDKLTDIALIKIEADNLVPAIFSNNSDKVVRGEWVVALGNPYKILIRASKGEPTATFGIISGNNTDFGLQEGGRVYQNMIQTDAKINEGNSGGPLINMDGRVIGINTFIVSESKGMGGIGFSIPIKRVSETVEKIKRFGKIKRKWNNGLTFRNLDEYKDLLRINFNDGVLVYDVEDSLSAEIAGIKQRDVIYKVNGTIVNSEKDIEECLKEGYFETGSNVRIILKRSLPETLNDNWEEIKVELKLIDPTEG